MSNSNFLRVISEILDSEGGYVDHPRDPGGATNMGITKRTLEKWRGRIVTKQEVRDLSRLEAKEIYRANYWEIVAGDDLPDGLDYVAVDGAVNSGPARGIRWLQKGIGAAADGRMGVKTIAAARSAGVESIERACAARMGFLQALSTWDAFGRGWSRRVAHVEAMATSMWHQAAHGADGAKAELARIVNREPEDLRRVAKKGTAEAGGAGAAGLGGGAAMDVSGGVLAALLIAVGTVVVLIVVKQARKSQYIADRAAAAEKIYREIIK